MLTVHGCFTPVKWQWVTKPDLQAAWAAWAVQSLPVETRACCYWQEELVAVAGERWTVGWRTAGYDCSTHSFTPHNTWHIHSSQTHRRWRKQLQLQSWQWWPVAIFSKLLRKILGRFLILWQSLTISGTTLTRHKFALLTNSWFNNNVT